MADKKFIDSLILEHKSKPHERILQKFIASELTKMVHSEEDLESVIKASEIFLESQLLVT